MNIEISKLTGWTHEGSWKFWCIPFTLTELIKLKQKFPDATSITINSSIWKHMKKQTVWTNLFSEITSDVKTGSVGVLAGLTVYLVDR